MTYKERLVPYTAGRPDYDDRTANRAIRNLLEGSEPRHIATKRRRKAKPLEQPPKYEAHQMIEEDPVEVLIALKKLRARGAITKEDFETKKTPLLEKMKGGI